MTIKKRWINSVVETAAKCSKPMPWERGATRAAMIAARKEPKLVRKYA